MQNAEHRYAGYPSYDNVPYEEMLAVWGLDLVRRIRRFVTRPGNMFDDAHFQLVNGLLISLETKMVLEAMKDETGPKNAIDTLLAIEIEEKKTGYVNTAPLSIHRADEPLESCLGVYETAKGMLKDPEKELGVIMSRNLICRDPAVLMDPSVMVIAPLSTDRLFFGVVRRILSMEHKPCFDLVTIACSKDRRIVTHNEREWREKEVGLCKNIYILQDQVSSGETARILHNYVLEKTVGNVYSASRITFRGDSRVRSE